MNSPCLLKTLGHPELKGPDGSPLKLKVRKHLALLIYLAVDGRDFHHREELVELLWNDVPGVRGRHSLSVALSVLRAALGKDAIETTASHVRLRERHLILDLELLERGDVLPTNGTAPLDIDRFLGTFEIETPGFQHWCDRQQAQLLPCIQAGILILMDHARRSGDTPGVLALSQRLLTIDPLSEEGIRAKVQALAMRGDRVSALRAYDGWKIELDRQLGAVPSEVLEALAARLRRRPMERPEPMIAQAIQTDHWADRDFFGRTAEFREISDAWDSVMEMNAHHVLITGDTGIGKSTLAMRFGASAALEGAAVARVQCFELEQRIAFGMIGALVTSLLDRPGAVATAPDSLAEIGRVVPKVKERFPNLPKPRPIEEDAARLRFAEGIFAMFDAIMEEQPLVLIIDDYPRSDEASLAVLHMLMRRVKVDRLMVVLTSRPPEPDEPAQATRIRKGISYLPLQHVSLSALHDSESIALLGSVLRSSVKQPNPSIRRAILLASSGNPMALSLLAQDWAAHGDGALAISLPAMRSDMPASAVDAVGYDRLLDRLLPAIPPRTRTALYLAAILGPRLNDLSCFEMLSLTSAQTIAALSELVERRVLRNAGGDLEFVNELIRARLYLRIPTGARTQLHSEVALRLLASIAAGHSVPALEVAWHCIRGRRREEATPYLMAGARDAITHGAPDEAARALSTALGHLTGTAKNEALLLLTEAYQEMGEWMAALECLEELRDGCRVNSYLGEMSVVLEIESRLQLGYYSTDELIAVGNECALRAMTYRHSASRVQAVLVAASTAARLRRPALAESTRAALSQLSLRDCDREHQGKLLLAKGITEYYRRAGDMGRDEALAGAVLLEEAGATDTTFVRIQAGLGAIACSKGEYLEAIPHLETAFNAASRLDNDSLMCMAAANLALCYYRVGAHDNHLKWADLSLERSIASLPGSYDRVVARAHRSLALIALERRDDAIKAMEQLCEAKEVARTPWILQAASLFEADALWLLGRKKNAYSVIRSMRLVTDAAVSTEFVGPFVRWSTLTLFHDRQTVEACGLLASVIDQIQMFDSYDQAEILGSREFLRKRIGLEIAPGGMSLQQVLARLPTACSRQLFGLGLLLPD